MAKDTDIKVAGDAPSYLTTHGAEGAETMPVTTSTPRLKLIQGMTDKGMKKEHGEGSLVLMPDELLVATLGEPVDAVPLYRWVSWQAWADLKDASAPSPVLAETTDIDHEVAVKARSPATRSEDYPDGRQDAKGNPLRLMYCEAINYVFLLDSGPCSGALAAFSFIRANHKHGANLSRYIDRQGAKGVPIYGNRITLTTDDETNRDNNTYVVLRGAPSEPAYVPEDQVETCRAHYNDFKSIHDQTTPGG